MLSFFFKGSAQMSFCLANQRYRYRMNINLLQADPESAIDGQQRRAVQSHGDLDGMAVCGPHIGISRLAGG
jgi:hypothetical protein